MQKDLQEMMYGFGDDKKPNKDSIALVEDFVNQFVTAMTKEASTVTTKPRIKTEDLLFVLRRDPKKYARAEELVKANKEIAKDKSVNDKASFGDLSGFDF
eukprot:TRINITY_DN16940_c0_g1_i2.p1 TRINITY_DN16940_c0_g1~~TRINITY_DN16940_c0_g1_i2.p1  ORF type:complete len:100 (-),score=33.55 TRINITY_DN16940_c0_g1_i2:134-433(-)